MLQRCYKDIKEEKREKKVTKRLRKWFDCGMMEKEEGKKKESFVVLLL